ncbi:MAG: ATP-binding protein [Clostridioides sp.]|jgi:hypothetical protein|nr:ATP-binding protein [Clostridioides sp.]
MITGDKRIRVITGHYGSGKSEFSMNYVVKLREMVEGKVALADMDVVNVYFRTREQSEFLESIGVEPISSSVNAPTLDIPAISAKVKTPMNDDSYSYVIDLGGDNVGARVLAGYRGLIKDGDYDFLCVVNANREKTQDLQQVMDYIKILEENSKLKVTGLVNNTHMIHDTTTEDIMRGYELCKEVSDKTGIPLKYNTCIENLVDELPADMDGEIFPINLYMRPDWL